MVAGHTCTMNSAVFEEMYKTIVIFIMNEIHCYVYLVNIRFVTGIFLSRKLAHGSSGSTTCTMHILPMFTHNTYSVVYHVVLLHALSWSRFRVFPFVRTFFPFRHSIFVIKRSRVVDNKTTMLNPIFKIRKEQTKLYITGTRRLYIRTQKETSCCLLFTTARLWTFTYLWCHGKHLEIHCWRDTVSGDDHALLIFFHYLLTILCINSQE